MEEKELVFAIGNRVRVRRSLKRSPRSYDGTEGMVTQTGRMQRACDGTPDCAYYEVLFPNDGTRYAFWWDDLVLVAPPSPMDEGALEYAEVMAIQDLMGG